MIVLLSQDRSTAANLLAVNFAAFVLMTSQLF